VKAVLDSPEPDPARPTPAGIYDYLLGGQHYSAADQAAAEQAVAMTPATRSEVIENRAFLRRAVRYLAGRACWTARTPRSSCATCAARRRSSVTRRPSG
jgi:hypothetical protein